MYELGCDKPVCEEPKTPYPCDECRWDYIDDTSGKLLNNTLVEKARAGEFRSFVSLVFGKFVGRPHDGVVFGNAMGRHQQGRRRQTVLPQSFGRASVRTPVIFHSDSTACSFTTRADLCNNRRSFQRCGTASCVDRTCGLDAVRRAPGTLLQCCSERSVSGAFCSSPHGKSKVGRLLRSMYGC